MSFLGFQTRYLNNRLPNNNAALINGSVVHPQLLFINPLWVLLGQRSHSVLQAGACCPSLGFSWRVSLRHPDLHTIWRSGCQERRLKIKQISLSCFLKKNKCNRLVPAPMHQEEKKIRKGDGSGKEEEGRWHVFLLS